MPLFPLTLFPGPILLILNRLYGVLAMKCYALTSILFHVIKNEKVALDRLRVRENVFLVIIIIIIIGCVVVVGLEKSK